LNPTWTYIEHYDRFDWIAIKEFVSYSFSLTIFFSKCIIFMRDVKFIYHVNLTPIYKGTHFVCYYPF
jgi:hypothetical protein